MTPRLQVCAQDDLVQPARPGVLGYRALVRDPLRPLHIPSRRHVHAVHELTDLPVDDLPVTRPQVGIAHTYDMGDIPDHTHHPPLSHLPPPLRCRAAGGGAGGGGGLGAGAGGGGAGGAGGAGGGRGELGADPRSAMRSGATIGATSASAFGDPFRSLTISSTSIPSSLIGIADARIAAVSAAMSRCSRSRTIVSRSISMLSCSISRIDPRSAVCSLSRKESAVCCDRSISSSSDRSSPILPPAAVAPSSSRSPAAPSFSTKPSTAPYLSKSSARTHGRDSIV